MKRVVFAALAGLSLASCAAQSSDRAPFDPAACYAREFNVYFEGLSTELSAEARAVVDAMGDSLRGCYIESVYVVGEADARAGVNTNEEVSELRAQELGEYLAQRIGWPRSRMTIAARGERGAVTDEGLNVPMRRRAHVQVAARAP